MSYWRFDLAEFLEEHEESVRKAKAELERKDKQIKEAMRK